MFVYYVQLTTSSTRYCFMTFKRSLSLSLSLSFFLSLSLSLFLSLSLSFFLSLSLWYCSTEVLKYEPSRLYPSTAIKPYSHTLTLYSSSYLEKRIQSFLSASLSGQSPWRVAEREAQPLHSAAACSASPDRSAAACVWRMGMHQHT